jgi:HSP20 family protein
VQVENDNVLKISGERKRDEFVTDTEIKYVRVERSAGKFMRKFNLPANANLDNITAACQDGLLTIIVPKHPPPDINRPRTFDVPVGSVSLSNQ